MFTGDVFLLQINTSFFSLNLEVQRPRL